MDEANYEKLAEELTSCVICTNKYFERDEDGIEAIPKVLECTHTFCNKCIAQHLKQCNSNRISPVSNFPCPTCRKVIFVPLKGIAAFPTDLKIKQIVELLQTIKTTNRPVSNTQNLCQTCHFKGSKVNGNYLCLTCQKIFCLNCRKLHQKLSFFVNHSFFNLDNQITSRGSKDLSNECSIHFTDLEYYCRTCSKSLCCICAMMPEHRDHPLTELSGPLLKEAESFYDDISELTNSEEELPKDEANLRKQAVIASLKQRKDRILAEVNLYDKCEIFKVCEESLNRAYKEAQKELKNRHTEMLLKLKENKSSFDRIVSKKDEILSTIKSVDKLLAEDEKTRKGNVEKFQKFLVKLKAFDESSFVEADQYKCNFKADIKVELGELIPDTQRNLSTLPSRRNVPLPNPDPKSGASDKRMSFVSQGDVLVKPPFKIYDSVIADAFLKSLKSLRFGRQTKIKPTEPTRYAVSNDMYQGLLHWQTKSLPKLKNVCFVDNGELIVALDTSFNSVEQQLVFLRSSDGSPVDLAIEDRVETLNRISNLCYCHETKQLFLLGFRDIQGTIKRFKITFNKRNMTCRLQCLETIRLATIKEPMALATNKKVVAVLESGGSKVTLFNSKFEKISEILEGEFNRASYLTVDRNDRIILSDDQRMEIKVFKNDELVLKFSSTGPKGEELLPRGVVTVTKQNNILVADQALSSVSLYNSDGNLLEVIVENVKNPMGICYSEGKHLLAVATETGLNVYKL